MSSLKDRQEAGETAFASHEVEFVAGNQRILAPLDVAFPRGQVHGLIGHNGSGKSTLLKLMARQIPASAGTLTYQDIPLSDWSDRNFARAVAFLPQDIPATPGLTVRELVAHGRYPWHGAFRRFSITDRKKTDQAMQLTGVDSYADRLVDSLSGGERQRVWIAMMVAQDADCLLLDEPISALDVAHQQEILTLIQSLSRDYNLTVIIVLHDVNLAARFCDRIFALKQGELIAEGPAETLLNEAQLKKIYGVEMGVIPHPSGEGKIAYV